MYFCGFGVCEGGYICLYGWDVLKGGNVLGGREKRNYTSPVYFRALVLLSPSTDSLITMTSLQRYI